MEGHIEEIGKPFHLFVNLLGQLACGHKHQAFDGSMLFPPASLFSTGNQEGSVFPVPVWAQAIRSCAGE
jgi:hypothetical protein